MIWVVPLAGKGQRTKELGEFKPFIEINGHKMIEWFISSIKNLIKPEDEFIFITTNYLATKYRFEQEIKSIFQKHNIQNNSIFIYCPETPKGTSSTILLTKDQINNDIPIMVINPDQYIDFNIPEIKPKSGFLGIYCHLGDKSGFVKIKKGQITKFVEKKNISNLASAGIYIISSGKELISAIENQIRNEKTLNGEFYIGPAFNYLIKKGFKILPFAVRAKYDLGNPEDIRYFSTKPFRC